MAIQRLQYFNIFRLAFLFCLFLGIFSPDRLCGQKRRIELSLMQYKFSNEGLVKSDSSSQVRERYGNIIPRLGLYFNFKKTKWIGIEYGYLFNNYTENSLITNNFITSKIHIMREIEMKTHHLALRIGEVFYIKKIQFIPSISFPVEYRYNWRITSVKLEEDKQTSTIFKEIKAETKYPNELKYGSFLNLGVAVPVSKKIYFGVQLGVGIQSVHYLGNLNDSMQEFQNNALVYEDSSQKEYRNSFNVKSKFISNLFISYCW
jgi:hypothetical protein